MIRLFLPDLFVFRFVLRSADHPVGKGQVLDFHRPLSLLTTAERPSAFPSLSSPVSASSAPTAVPPASAISRASRHPEPILEQVVRKKSPQHLLHFSSHPGDDADILVFEQGLEVTADPPADEYLGPHFSQSIGATAPSTQPATRLIARPKPISP